LPVRVEDAAEVRSQLVARHAGDALDIDHEIGVDEVLAVRPVRDRLFGASDCTSEGGFPAHSAAGHGHGLAHAPVLGFGSHRFASASWISETTRSIRDRVSAHRADGAPYQSRATG